MYSRILDPQTYSKVIALAPEIQAERNELGRAIVDLLSEEIQKSVDSEPHQLPNGSMCLSMPAMVLTDALENTGHPCNPHVVGAVLGDLGLQKHRRKEGYLVFWNDVQIKLLAGYFESQAHHD